MPDWDLDLNSKKVDVKRLVFLIDNLTEMVNPIFRSNGVQLFFDDEKVYRYYYRIDLNKSIIIVSLKKNIKIDFFEHIIEPENFEESQIFIYENGEISEGKVNGLFEEVRDKINELKNIKDFNREYVINQVFDAFKFNILEPQREFLKTPFPKEIIEFYIRTCQIPEEKLSQGIYHILGGLKMILNGTPVSEGKFKGTIKIYSKIKKFEAGDILVAKFTSPEMCGEILNVGAVLTEYGGLLSHTSIFCREIKKPCIVGLKDILNKVSDGMMVIIDGKEGTVKIISNEK